MLHMEAPIPAWRLYPARRPLTYLLMVYAAVHGCIWWFSNPRRAFSPTYASLRRVGSGAGFHDRPMQFWALLFIAAAVAIGAAIASRKRGALYVALFLSCALWFTYLSATAFSIGNHHAAMPAGTPPPALPSYAPIGSFLFIGGCHVIAIVLTARDSDGLHIGRT
jgi:hypothetical protein